MSTNYKLRQCIDAHESDVKSLCILPQNEGFLSASRDLSVGLWKEDDHQFRKKSQYLNHKNYISVVYYMEPCSKFPDGVILSAGYDKVIKGYFLYNNIDQFSLSGHTNTVNSISSFGNGDILSGSMDCTVILWEISTFSIKRIFEGHKHGIWSLIVLDCISGDFLTASADKEIFLWNKNNKDFVKKFVGHTDCVRGLVEMPNTNQYLSCSNDTTIRLWCLKTGSCTNVFKGHSSFIYAISRLSDNKFASCGEEGIVCIWSLINFSGPLQQIVIKAQSVWSIIAFNDDIAIGSSDGMIRIFSEDTLFQNGIDLERKTNDEIIDESQVRTLISVGVENLSLPGKYNNQLMKVHDEDCEILYEWSVDKELWVKKRVLENSSTNINQTKKHDYVFSIDVKDGEPALSLCYNIGQDPWMAAKQFIDDNNLSPMFLDQIANFIINNSDQQAPAASHSNQLIDPFTGTSRYVPTNNPDDGSNSKYFPILIYSRFEQINATGLLKKVQELSTSNHGIPDNIKNLIENIQVLSSDQSITLCKWVLESLPSWPNYHLYPLIDMLRILVRESMCNSICFSNNEFMEKLLQRTIECSPTEYIKGNTLTIIKLMVNAFLHFPGENLMNSMSKRIAKVLNDVMSESTDKHIMVAIASLLLNFSVFINIRQEENLRIKSIEMCLIALKVFESNNCPEAVHRTLGAIGTLVCNNESFTFRETLTMSVFEKINSVSKSFNDENKWGSDVKNCSQQLGLLISSLDFLSF